MDNKLLYYIWLSEKLYPGSESPKILLEQFGGGIERIYYAEKDEYLKLGINPGDAERLSDKCLENAEKYYEYCAAERIGILCYDNPFYPERLKLIQNPPAMFYYKGRIEMLDDYPCFAMVGTRSCTESGYRIAYEMGYRTASRGAVPINGLALGIDSAVLRGALDADGFAVALLGCGIDRIYPSANAELFKKLARRGLIMTEFHPFTPPGAENFPIRNRCISGLSLGTVVFEAEASSGAVHTANHAYVQGRRIYAVPGEISDTMYGASFNLIRHGAVTVTSADDFIMEYAGMFPHRIEKGSPPKIPTDLENKAVTEAFGERKSSSHGTSDSADEREQSAKKRSLPKPHYVSTARKPKNTASVPPGRKKADTPQSLSESPAVVISESQSSDEISASVSTAQTDALSPCEKSMLALFDKKDILSLDEIVSCGLKPDDALSSLTLLEIYGMIKSLPGGRFKKI